MRRALQARRGATGENVDSLLDTMANVVGILVVLMAVTQLTVNDAMKRIQVWESDEAVSLREERAAAEAELESSAGEDLSRTLELSQLREHLRTLRKTPKGSDTATLAADVARQRLAVRRLEARIADGEEKLANLQILLAQSQARAEQPGIPLRLPDPRPAPVGSQRLLLFCRYGRVVDPRFDTLTRELESVLRSAPGPIDRYFESYDVGNELLRWKVFSSGRDHFYRLEWRRRDIGESVEQLRSPDSPLRRRIAELDPHSRYLHFYVWGDSFEVYLEARRIAEEAGFSVGWRALPEDTPLDLERRKEAPAPVD